MVLVFKACKFINNLTTAKIKGILRYLCVSVFIEKNVLELQISVTDVVLVTVIDGRDDLPKDPLGLVLLQTLLLAQVVVEFTSGCYFHHQDHLFLVFEN